MRVQSVELTLLVVPRLDERFGGVEQNRLPTERDRAGAVGNGAVQRIDVSLEFGCGEGHSAASVGALWF